MDPVGGGKIQRIAGLMSNAAYQASTFRTIPLPR
jgi:hypothetical protein